MSRQNYIDMANSIDNLQAEKERLERIIMRIDFRLAEIERRKSKYNKHSNNSTPTLMDAYGEMSSGGGDISDGSLRTKYEHFANVQIKDINKTDKHMKESLELMDNKCKLISDKKYEYQRQIESINSEISEIEAAMANRLGGL